MIYFTKWLQKCICRLIILRLNDPSSGGWIIRDHNGNAKTWGSSVLGYVITPLEAETKALLVAMQQAWIQATSKFTLKVIARYSFTQSMARMFVGI